MNIIITKTTRSWKRSPHIHIRNYMNRNACNCLPTNKPALPTIQELFSVFSSHSNMAWNVTKVKKYIQRSCPIFVNIEIHFDTSITRSTETPQSSRSAPNTPTADNMCGLINRSNTRSVTSITQKGVTKDCNRGKVQTIDLSSTIKVVLYDLWLW